MKTLSISPMRTSTTLLLVLLGVLATATGSARAETPRSSVAKIERYLDTASAARTVLSYVHMATQYRGHEYVDEYTINGKPNWFGVKYRYYWANDGITDVLFTCDAAGSIREVRVTATNAVLNQPWVVAQASIRILSQAILDSTKLDDKNRATLQQLVDAEDVRGMLVFVLP